ncbi:Stk1 family PASTA domain-containing Ser/Thr kinase [Paenibacillus pasadenensis]|uniref:Stk1 family PASTA domain-containing Ser/Thr kinase n=1 Tax=Paenibacillus pasadenensis TaxID=217090 RepID=UPI00203DE0D1|nr:Stk1 family PASTA domain-containing Ser/Thr kinase [Paenibacillus pasadenensis]MCM3746141.1 Stk1 family PASTA domain-containing Ser/Thr kinase [Paenibacillus pasadenensis]
MIGRELGGRYEILTRIGGGGMALVYKAHDLLLSRNVAVKVLRQQYVHDEEFIRRFRREAQSAAALSHPNVVSIYDVGQEEDIHYIVMEYIEGYNLNEVIQERAPLQADEAVRVAAQIADALDHAHQNHIIHRDIKPHNILIGRNGRVKVTDFGIARAVTSSTITQTGSVIGSVHYFSPEHAKGVSTGEKSDIYSLGIVLYQMVTGKLPFLGESPISVALKHLQEPLEDPRTVNPLVPQSVENIIIKAMRKNPSERYRTAGEMLEDLETALSPQRKNEPKLQFGAGDFDETRVMPAIRPGRDLKPQDTVAAAANDAQDEDVYSTGRQQTAREEEDEVRGRKAWKKPLIIVLSTLLLLALVYVGFRLVSGSLDVDEVDVPYVVGMTETEAKAALEQAGLFLEEPTIRQFKPDIPKDQVFAQSKANMRVKEGSRVKLSVSNGPELKAMGDYTGQKAEDVLAALQELGIPAESISQTEVFDDKAEPGTVLSQNPAPQSELDPLTAKVTLTVSKGAESVEMPDLVGKTTEEARKLILQAGLQITNENIVKEGSYKPVGEVLSQFPYDAGSKVTKGAQVSITVSSGLPKDALEYTFDLLISPAQAGKASEIRIVYTDATGKEIQAHKRAIKETRSFPVKVVLAPNTEAFVSVYRDGQLADTFSRTYDDVKNGSDSGPMTVPGADASPPPNETEGQNNDTDILNELESALNNRLNGENEQGRGNEGGNND